MGTCDEMHKYLSVIDWNAIRAGRLDNGILVVGFNQDDRVHVNCGPGDRIVTVIIWIEPILAGLYSAWSRTPRTPWLPTVKNAAQLILLQPAIKGRSVAGDFPQTLYERHASPNKQNSGYEFDAIEPDSRYLHRLSPRIEAVFAWMESAGPGREPSSTAPRNFRAVSRPMRLRTSLYQ